MSLTADLIERLEQEIPSYNVRPLSLNDFEALCVAEGIITFEHTMPARGWYFVIKGVPFIVINKHLSPGHKTFIGFHEYFHHKYHPGGHLYYKTLAMENKIELQASVMAAIAIIPTAGLALDLIGGESVPEKYNIPIHLAEFRLMVHRVYERWD